MEDLKFEWLVVSCIFLITIRLEIMNARIGMLEDDRRERLK